MRLVLVRVSESPDKGCQGILYLDNPSLGNDKRLVPLATSIERPGEPDPTNESYDKKISKGVYRVLITKMSKRVCSSYACSRMLEMIEIKKKEFPGQNLFIHEGTDWKQSLGCLLVYSPFSKEDTTRDALIVRLIDVIKRNQIYELLITDLKDVQRSGQIQ